jgi:acetyltransferase-like isoleucine patch superfamily enzyme
MRLTPATLSRSDSTLSQETSMSSFLSEIEAHLAQHPRRAALPEGWSPRAFDGRRILLEAASLPVLAAANITVTGEFGPGNVLFIPREGICKKLRLSFARGSRDNILSFASVENLKLDIKVGGFGNTAVFDGDNTIGGSINFKDAGGVLLVGHRSTANHMDVLLAGRDRMVTLGEDCMLATGITLRTSDSHSVIDLLEDRAINPVDDVQIEQHVWLGARVTVMKGVRIGRGSIVGGGSFVTRDVPPFSLAVGTPARVVKQNVSWSRAMLSDPARTRQFSQELKARLGYPGSDPAA